MLKRSTRVSTSDRFEIGSDEDDIGGGVMIDIELGRITMGENDECEGSKIITAQ